MIPDSVFTLPKAKAHLRVVHALEDDLISTFLDAAVAACERATRRAWTQRTWSVALPAGACSSSSEFHALLSPATAKVFASDGAGGEAELAADSVVTATWYGHTVVLIKDFAPFVVTEGDVGRIEYDAKPRDDAVPPDVYAAAMLYLGDLYENREAQVIGTIVRPNALAEMLLRPYVLELHA